ncbi:MAG TPA: SLC26A/SulP transporter family protein [Rhodocyclaceae bacterium]|nr:SLC26A/SulP transporter family protein [Rhodocyclaceae bacterium]
MPEETQTSNRDLTGDIWGGLSAMLVALPSAIAFGVTIFAALPGSLAAQGALAGLLGATALGLVAPAFGGSSRLITAPCAPAAAVLSALAVTLTQQGTEAADSLLLIGMIGLLAGVIQIGFGLSGIGRLIRFIPYPVVSGYLSGVGLIIIGSQIPKLVGAPSGAGLIGTLKAPMAWTWQSMVIGGVVIVAMELAPRLIRAVPAAILALLAGVGAFLALAWFDPALFHTDHNQLLVGALGSADTSLVDLTRQHWQALLRVDFHAVVQVLVPSLTLAALLSIDTLKTGVVLDALTNSHSNPNRELVGQGLGNIAAALIGGVPGSGTMGASLINVSSGGRTRRAGMIEGGLSLLTFLALTPLVAWIPIPALAGILIVIGFRMIDRHSLAFFFSATTRLDFAVIVSVILVAVFGNLIAASGVGVALAILLFLREQTRSSVVRHRIEGQDIFSRRQPKHHTTVSIEASEGSVVVFELQGSLFFGTASQLQAALEPEVANRKYVILSMRRVQSLDLTATHVLEQIKDKLEEHNAYLVFCDIPKGLPSGLKMKRFLKDTGIVRPTNKAFAFRQLDEALEWVEAHGQSIAEQEVQPPVMDLRDMPIFAPFDEEALAALERATKLHHFKAGKKLFKAGSQGDELYLIRSGTVKLTIPIHKKDSYHLATCEAGEIVGGTGFLDGGTHTADAHALTDVEAYALSSEHFLALSKEQGPLTLALIEGVARNLGNRLRIAVAEIQALRD